MIGPDSFSLLGKELNLDHKILLGQGEDDTLLNLIFLLINSNNCAHVNHWNKEQSSEAPFFFQTSTTESLTQEAEGAASTVPSPQEHSWCNQLQALDLGRPSRSNAQRLLFDLEQTAPF